MSLMHPAITAIGAHVPERMLSNADLERLVDTSDAWIIRRTGIRNRRIADEHEYTSDLCRGAVADLLRRYPVSLADVDLVIACTHTPDYGFPGVANRVALATGVPESAGTFDLNAVCAGFVYALQVAGSLVMSRMYRKVLVVAGDTMSKVTDYADRTTCVLFGDGAGAALVEAAEEPSFLARDAGHHSAGGMHVYRSGLSGMMDGVSLTGGGKVVQNGPEVYRYAVSTLTARVPALAAMAGLDPAHIDWFAPHNANLRMIESVCEKTGIPPDKVLASLEEYGNTSAASIPLSIVRGLDDGRVRKGDVLLLYGFGGGLTHAGLVIRWAA